MATFGQLLDTPHVAVSESNLVSAVGFSKRFAWKMASLRRGLPAQSEGQDRPLAWPVLPTAIQTKFGER